MSIAEKTLKLKQDFDGVKAAGYAKGYADGAATGGNTTEAYNEGVVVGRKAEHDEFWEIFQVGGNRQHYANAFAYYGWNDTNYDPIYPITPTNASGIQGAFRYAYNITDTKVSITAFGDANYAFYNCNKLKRIPELIFNDTASINSAFNGCTALEEMNCKGELSINGLNLSACTKLSLQSIMSVINCLKTFVFDASSGLVLNGPGQDIDNTYTIETVTFYDHPQMGFKCITITFSDADFTIDLYQATDENLQKICAVGNKVYIKFSSTTGPEQCIVYDKNATTTHTLTLGTTNLAKLTDAEKAKATQKGWTLA